MDEQDIQHYLTAAWDIFEASREATKHLKMVPFTLSVMTERGAVVLPVPFDPAADKKKMQGILTALQAEYQAVFFVHEAWMVKARTRAEVLALESLPRIRPEHHPMRVDALVGNLYLETGHSILFSCEIKTDENGKRRPLTPEATGVPGIKGDLVPTLSARFEEQEM